MNKKELIQQLREAAMILKAGKIGKLKPEAESRLDELLGELDQVGGADLFIEIFEMHTNNGFRLFEQLKSVPEKYLS